MIVFWIHNNTNDIPLDDVTTTDDTTTLVISDLQPSDSGVYQCMFINTNGWRLRRNIRLFIIGS